MLDTGLALAPIVTKPAIYVELVVEVAHLFETQSTSLDARNNRDYVMRHAATNQWMHGHRQQWEAQGLYMTDVRTASRFGVDQQDEDTCADASATILTR